MTLMIHKFKHMLFFRCSINFDIFPNFHYYIAFKAIFFE